MTRNEAEKFSIFSADTVFPACERPRAIENGIMKKASEYKLPVPKNLARKLADKGHPLAALAAMSEAECRSDLKKTWSAITHPSNKSLAKYILGLPKVVLSEAGEREYWLTFSASDEEKVSIIAAKPGDPLPSLDFPLDTIPGLKEFLTYFSGVTDWYLPPGSHFCPPSDLRLMWSADEASAGGLVKEWDGSLVFYAGGTCDVIVVRKDGRVGKWHHEYAFPDEEYRDRQIAFMKKLGIKFSVSQSKLHQCPVLDLKCDFGKLVSRYPAYCRLGADSDKKGKTPFYY